TPAVPGVGDLADPVPPAADERDGLVGEAPVVAVTPGARPAEPAALRVVGADEAAALAGEVAPELRHPVGVDVPQVGDRAAVGVPGPALDHVDDAVAVGVAVVEHPPAVGAPPGRPRRRPPAVDLGD